MAYKLVRVSEQIEVPVSLGLTPEQETEIIVKGRTELPWLQPEVVELKWLLDHPADWIAFEDILAEIENPPLR